MYTASELNLVRIPEGEELSPIYEPRAVHAYLGQGGTALLLGYAGAPALFWVYFAAITKAEDEAQNAVLFDAAINGEYMYQAEYRTVLKQLGLSYEKLCTEWIRVEFDQPELSQKTPAELAGTLAHAYRLYSTEAKLRAADSVSYIRAMGSTVRECYAARHITELHEIAPIVGAVGRILDEDRCMLLSDDESLRAAYGLLQEAEHALDLRFSELRHKKGNP